jgi:hypothetical protein
MLTPVEIAAVVAATKGALDVFDKLARPIKRVLLGSKERHEQAEAKDQRWRFKIGAEGDDIVVREKGERRQTITGAELSQILSPSDLVLVQTYERKMQEYFDRWNAVYAEKDSSQDPDINAKTDRQLKNLVVKMRGELVGILNFLQRIGVHLDDHYMHVRSLVENARPDAAANRGASRR